MARNIDRFNFESGQIIKKLLEKATTEKQRRILFALKKDEFRFVSTTQAVKSLASEMNCAESTVWDSISALKQLELVICNGRIELTKEGVLCAGIMGSD